MIFTERFRTHHDASRDLKNKYASPETGEAYLSGILQNGAPGRRVIYLHVPFCNKVCTFCPFHRPDELDRRAYHHYLIAQIHALCAYPFMQAPIDAVNFGGGTPTSLSPEQMAAVLAALRECFTFTPGAEISVETSATELTDEMLAVLTAGGVNRLSVGIQTFDDGIRKLLGRRGSGEFAASRVAAAMQAGIQNTGVDLIYNYPGQTDTQLLSDLARIRALDAAGVSFYSLMLHEKTPLYRRLGEAEKASMRDLSREKELFDMILDTLGEGGYRMMELTKLVKAGRDRYDYMEIRHNGGSCIAVGHGAGGNLGNYFYHNSHSVPDISDGIRICSRGRVLLPAYRDVDALIWELQKGRADLAAHSERLGVDLMARFGDALGELAGDGYLTVSGSTVSLTREGVFFGNNIISLLIGRLTGD